MEWGFRFDPVEPVWSDFFGDEPEPVPLLEQDLRRIFYWMKARHSVKCGWHPPRRSMAMNGGLVEQGPSQQVQVPTLNERLEQEEEMLRERLEKVCQIRAGLAGNPDVAELLDGLAQLGLGRY
jgi:hypothetical protein